MATTKTRKASSRGLPGMLKDRCLLLLLSLLLLLFAYPYGKVHPLLVLSLNGLTLIAGIYAVGTIRKHVVIAAVISTLQVLSAAMYFKTGSILLDVIAAALIAIFYIYVLVIVLAYVMKGEEVTRDEILGAVSVYLLLGFIWASFYHIVFSLQPQAFLVSDTPVADNGRARPDFVYFSFITLLTVGYGDFRPISGIARSLAMLEGIVGVLYIGVFITRLLTIYKPGTKKTDSSEQ
ncbi:MAG: ion channel [Nitrospirota bacterium]